VDSLPGDFQVEGSCPVDSLLAADSQVGDNLLAADSQAEDNLLAADSQVGDSLLVEDIRAADSLLAADSSAADSQPDNQVGDNPAGDRLPPLPVKRPVFRVLQRCR